MNHAKFSKGSGPIQLGVRRSFLGQGQISWDLKDDWDLFRLRWG